MEPVTILLKNHTKDENTVEIEIPFDLFQYLSSENFDIQNVCRVCLSTSNDDMYPLFCTKDNSILANMFTALALIQINQQDGLPENICKTCHTQIMKWYEFRLKCEKSDHTLKSVLKGEFIAKESIVNGTSKEETEIDEMKKLESIVPVEVVKQEWDSNEDIEFLDEDFEAITLIQNTHRKDGLSATDEKKHRKESKKKHKQKQHCCSFCSKRFSSAKALRAHTSESHEAAGGAFACPHCRQSLQTEHDYRLHAVLHTAGPAWTCPVCHKSFTDRGPLRRHLARHMQAKRFSCARCGKPFAELYALRRHERVHTGEVPAKRLACSVCGKKFRESAALSEHVSRHTGLKPCACGTCGKAFPTARLLRSHRLVHSDLKPHACQFCDKRFRHESTRTTHQRTHTGERPYVCARCGKAFIQNSNLTLHMRTHTGERPYSCGVCQRQFSSGSSLKYHARTHSGERPYACDVCGKRFARVNFRAHMRLHAAERPFACRLCDKRFVKAARLKEHSRVHTGEKPFECATCTNKFMTKSHLIKHLKSHEKRKKRVVMVRKFNPPVQEGVIYIKGDTGCGNVIQNDTQYKTTESICAQDNANIKTELILVNNQNMTGGLNYVAGDINYGNDVNLVTVNEGEVSISSSSALLEGTTVKLYQLDQSLVQIQTSGGQLTISKITSKMTTNF